VHVKFTCSPRIVAIILCLTLKMARSPTLTTPASARTVAARRLSSRGQIYATAPEDALSTTSKAKPSGLGCKAAGVVN
jgi:hypothetical protein